jgi:peptidoglycan hydrolase-like protein with peptidoglycan-binding domain
MNLAGKFRQLVEQQPFDQFQTTRDRDTAKWISQHGGAAIALVGDSIAFGISSQLNQGVEADAAVGLTSTAVLGRVKSNVKLKNATTAVISVGSNDIVGGKGNAAMLTANAQKIRNELNAKQYIWIVPYDSVAAEAIDKAKGAGDQLIALKDFKTNDGVHPGSYTAVANAIRTITKKSAPATPSNATTPADGGGDGKRNSEDPRRSDAPAGTGSAAQPEDLETLQKALMAAGFDLPKYGADGKMGPETKQAILRAEQKLGRSPTGSITTQELAKLSGTATTTPAATTTAKPMDADKLAKLTQSVANIEQALSRIKKESIQRDPVSEIAQWRNIVEADSIYVPPSTGGGARSPDQQASMKAAASGGNTSTGGASSTSTPSRLKRFGQKFANRVMGSGSGSKAAGAARAAGSLVMRAALPLNLALTAYQLYGAWQDMDEEDKQALNDEVRAVVERELETIMTMADDPEAMGTIPKELRDRIEKIKQQLEND